MATLPRPRTTTSAVTTLVLLLLAASPALAVKIPEREYVPAGLTSVVHLRVDEGCAGAPTDGIEVGIPEGLSGVTPQAVPGWTVETETVATEATDGDGSAQNERVSVIRWTGGSLPDGQFMDFAFRARFPDEVGTVLTLPVVQTCGSERVEWTDAEGSRAAPVVRLDQAVTQGQLAETVASLAVLSTEVETLSTEIERIQERLGAVNLTGLRNRVEELEAATDELAEQLAVLQQLMAEAESTQP
jgi:uncharacterized protein YcnI